MFGKTINTKIDHVAAFKRVIDMAVSEARDAHVGSSVIVSYLRSRAQAIEDQAYQGQYVAPRMHDQSGKPIDWNAKVHEAQRERQRIADEGSIIPPHERQIAASGYKVPR